MDKQLLATYLSMERRQALARQITLPDHAVGSALFADISGFTPLTESLVRSLGARLGAEEVVRHLGEVYSALIASVDQYHGSVVDFSGDAITCWFEGEDAPLLAVTCAFAMQAAMRPFADMKVAGDQHIALSVKTAVASGPARRLCVGDPAIQRIDVMAGRTLLRMANAEHHATRGEVLIDERTVAALDGQLQISEWRRDDEDGSESSDKFAVIGALLSQAAPRPWPALAAEALSLEDIYPWLHNGFRAHLEDGLGEFPSELRPCVALFLRFGGIDYDADEEAGEKLDTFIRQVQKILAQYEGLLLDITIGDKGSYLYAGFGAPVAHEDDARRGVDAAMRLRELDAQTTFITSVQIGLSRGTMLTGPVGGKTRRVYSILGDEVNLAARLMQHAEPGMILVSATIQKATESRYFWEPLPHVQLKGKTEPVAVAALRSSQPLAEAANFTTPFVGREEELARLRQFIQPIFGGQFAGMFYLYGEAGMGKSRLVYELRQDLGERVFWCNCAAEPILHESLHPFKKFLSRYFGQDTDNDDATNRAHFDQVLANLQAFLATLNPLDVPDAHRLSETLARRSMSLCSLVDLPTDSAYEQTDPRLRFENMLTALKTIFLVESLQQPVVLYVADAHWLDSDSEELIRQITRDADGYRLAVLLCSRYKDDGERYSIAVGPSVPQQMIDLSRLSRHGVSAIATQILGGPISVGLTDFLVEVTEGNPFFLEQLALDLRERGLLRETEGTWHVERRELAEIPVGVNAVLVARLDRLTAQVRMVVQMAAVLGHEVEVKVLSQMLKDDEMLESKMKQAEEQVIWSALGDVSYLFRHALLREAAYDMQLQARLREVHALAGRAIEALYADDLPPQAANLAHHYRRAEDPARERQYVRLAGLRAATRFANTEAVQHLGRALELSNPDDINERYALVLLREQVYDRLGDRAAQIADLTTLAELAEQLADDERRAEAALRRASFDTVTGNYHAAIESAQKAVKFAQAARRVDSETLARLQWGNALLRQAQYAHAANQIEQGYMLAQAAGRLDLQGDSLSALGTLALRQNNFDLAQRYLEQALPILRQIGSQTEEAMVLNHLGQLAYERGEYESAQRFLEQGLQLSHEVGDRIQEAVVLVNLGALARDMHDLETARQYNEQALRLSQEIDSPDDADAALINLARVFFDKGDLLKARQHAEQALTISREIGDREDEDASLFVLGEIAMRGTDLPGAQAYFDQALRLARDIGDERQESIVLNFLGELALAQGNPRMAQEHLKHALHIAERIEAQPEAAKAQTLLDKIES